MATAQSGDVEPQLYMVPMRDGVCLATDVYLPTDAEPPYPAVLLRGPYGRSGANGMRATICGHGYALVSQDVRGRGDSEGHHAIIFHHGGLAKLRDGHDTIDWIGRQTWSDGNVATMGGSALGITQNMLAPGAPANLKAQVVEVAFSNMYAQCVYQGGAFRQEMIETWLEQNRLVDRNLAAFRAHPAYDQFWAELNPESQADRVNVPGIFVGGWYDVFLQGTINSFVSIQHGGAPQARGNCRLIVGPWAHGAVEELTYPPESSRRPAAADAMRFIDHWLRGTDNGAERDRPVHYFVMGDPTDVDAPGNVWRAADDWPPPAEPTPMYLHADGSLGRDVPTACDASATYPFDPRDPVPTVGGQNLYLAKGPMDQREVESRADVLVYTSDALAEPLEVTGPISATLYVSSDCVDTDFTVKLCDVYPDGRSLLVTDGILRARYHRSFAEPQLLVPGNVYRLDIDLWSTSLAFNRGHRIRVAVSSSNAPRFEPNPNTGRLSDEDGETRVASNTVYLSADHPSHVTLPIYGDHSDVHAD